MFTAKLLFVSGVFGGLIKGIFFPGMETHKEVSVLNADAAFFLILEA